MLCTSGRPYLLLWRTRISPLSWQARSWVGTDSGIACATCPGSAIRHGANRARCYRQCYGPADHMLSQLRSKASCRRFSPQQQSPHLLNSIFVGCFQLSNERGELWRIYGLPAHPSPRPGQTAFRRYRRMIEGLKPSG